MNAYPRYLKAAKRKTVIDPASIFEVAASDPDITARQIGQLAGELHHRHGFKLAKAQRDPLIDALLEEGMTPTEIANRIGCNPRTVARRLAEKVGVADGLDTGSERDKNGSADPYPQDRSRAAQDAYLRSVGREWVDPTKPAEGTRPMRSGRR